MTAETVFQYAQRQARELGLAPHPHMSAELANQLYEILRSGDAKKLRVFLAPVVCDITGRSL